MLWGGAIHEDLLAHSSWGILIWNNHCFATSIPSEINVSNEVWTLVASNYVCHIQSVLTVYVFKTFLRTKDVWEGLPRHCKNWYYWSNSQNLYLSFNLCDEFEATVPSLKLHRGQTLRDLHRLLWNWEWNISSEIDLVKEERGCPSLKHRISFYDKAQTPPNRYVFCSNCLEKVLLGHLLAQLRMRYVYHTLL